VPENKRLVRIVKESHCREPLSGATVSLQFQRLDDENLCRVALCSDVQGSNQNDPTNVNEDRTTDIIFPESHSCNKSFDHPNLHENHTNQS